MVSVRWLVCLATFATIWFSHWVLQLLENPTPLYFTALGLVVYNAIFALAQRRWSAGPGNVERNIFLQVLCDLLALTLLLYFADMPHNPFLFYFVFHMIIGGMYLRNWAPYFFAGLATALVGGVFLAEYLHWIPSYPLLFEHNANAPPGTNGMYLFGTFAAFASTVWVATYFTTSIRRYVDRAHAQIRQKEKLVGIGQLVAGIAHQIANPLDGLQNCLQRIGERVKDDFRTTEYVRMMFESLRRIEQTAKRVQAFARPSGISLCPTDVNSVVEATIPLLGITRSGNMNVQTNFGEVPPVQGDPYTLQEVLFNLCTNALAAMPDGGTLTVRTRELGRQDDDQMGSVAIEVSDTGIGIPQSLMEKVFEPFFTTKADRGGTGLGLGLCRMLISEMGGRIELKSALDHGTTFTVIMNRAMPAPAKADK